MTDPDSNKGPVVNSFNEWDPLEEVIVGILDEAMVEGWEPCIEAIAPASDVDRIREFHMQKGGTAIVTPQKRAASEELDNFARILKAEGVTVRRPTPIAHSASFSSPSWKVPCGAHLASPRDLLIVIGNEILEAASPFRSRYFETFGYRDLLKEYFRKGAKWTAAPRPELRDELYKKKYVRGEEYITTEFEPVFDAADMVRCGRDIFIQRSNANNDFGIEWLARHLEPNYNLHPLDLADDRAIHIDATFVPLAPGKILVNPDRPLKHVPPILKRGGWELLTAPASTLPSDTPDYLGLRWLSMNVLSLDEKRICVEQEEEPLQKALKGWGFEVIPVPFRNKYAFGGGLHCATLDIRRRGTLQSYF